jgi:hypothetical protein
VTSFQLSGPANMQAESCDWKLEAGHWTLVTGSWKLELQAGDWQPT